jgi:hypothetical protein
MSSTASALGAVALGLMTLGFALAVGPEFFVPGAMDGAVLATYAWLYPKIAVLVLGVSVGLIALLMRALEPRNGVSWRAFRHARARPVMAVSASVSIVAVAAAMMLSQGGMEANLLGRIGRSDGHLALALAIAALAISLQISGRSTRSATLGVWFVSATLITSATWSLLQIIGGPGSLIAGPTAVALAAGGLGHASSASVVFAIGVLFFASAWLSDQTVLRPWFVLGSLALVTTALGAAGGRAAWVGLAFGAIALVLRQRAVRRMLVLVPLVAGSWFMGYWFGASAGKNPSSLVMGDSSFVSVATSGRSTQLRIHWIRHAVRKVSDVGFGGLGPLGFNDSFWLEAPECARLAVLDARFGLAGDDVVLTGTELTYLRGQSDNTSLVFFADKAHNFVLDLIIQHGWGALMGVALALGTATFLAGASSHWLATAALASLVCYAVYGLAWFFSSTVDPLVFTIVGVLVGSGSAQGRQTT